MDENPYKSPASSPKPASSRPRHTVSRAVEAALWLILAAMVIAVLVSGLTARV